MGCRKFREEVRDGVQSAGKRGVGVNAVKGGGKGQSPQEIFRFFVLFSSKSLFFGRI